MPSGIGKGRYIYKSSRVVIHTTSKIGSSYHVWLQSLDSAKCMLAAEYIALGIMAGHSAASECD